MTLLDSAQRFGAATRTRHTRQWVAAVVLAVVVAACVWVVWFSSLLSVREVRVLGASEVSADTVRAAVAVPLGQPLARADVAGIIDRVSAIPRVAGVEVRRGWPDVLVVVVTERTPLVVTRSGSGYAYLDATGARFGSLAGAPRGLPVVTASSESAMSSALEVVSALPPALRATVATVSARTRDDVVLLLPGGVSVQWGSADQSERKVAVLASLLKVRARSYDVSAPDLPTTQGSLTVSPSP